MILYSFHTWDLVRAVESASSASCKTPATYIDSILLNNRSSYNIIVNRKNFYDQFIDSDIKRFKERRKLTRGQGEDYTTGYLLDYEYIKIIID